MDSKPIYHIPFREQKGCVLFEVLAACISRPLQPTKAPKAPAYVYVTPALQNPDAKQSPSYAWKSRIVQMGFNKFNFLFFAAHTALSSFA